MNRPDAVPAAACVHLANTCDVEEQAALLQGWNQSYAQMSPGVFAGHIEEGWLGGVHLFVEETSRSLWQRGALAAERVALGVPLSLGRGRAVFCGGASWASHFCSFSGPGGFEFLTPEGLQMAGVALDRAELCRLTTPAEQEELARIGGDAGLYPAQAPCVDGLRGFMCEAFKRMRTQPELLQHAGVVRALRGSALSKVLDVLLSASDTDTETSPRRQWQLVSRAREWVQSEPDAALTVAALCVELGVSRRTLQASFQGVLGMAPATFLRAHRLAGARRALRDSPSVAEAAALWGFWHFSHFAQDYRSMFGELPSQTWKRLHAPPLH